MYLVKTPRLLKWLYPNLIWNMAPDARCIYLTFDDGPIPIVTPFVLNILKQYKAKATFFFALEIMWPNTRTFLLR